VFISLPSSPHCLGLTACSGISTGVNEKGKAVSSGRYELDNGTRYVYMKDGSYFALFGVKSVEKLAFGEYTLIDFMTNEYTKKAAEVIKAHGIFIPSFFYWKHSYNE
jgi:hypothetical protein